MATHESKQQTVWSKVNSACEAAFARLTDALTKTETFSLLPWYRSRVLVFPPSVSSESPQFVGRSTSFCQTAELICPSGLPLRLLSTPRPLRNLHLYSFTREILMSSVAVKSHFKLIVTEVFFLPPSFTGNAKYKMCNLEIQLNTQSDFFQTS